MLGDIGEIERTHSSGAETPKRKKRYDGGAGGFAFPAAGGGARDDGTTAAPTRCQLGTPLAVVMHLAVMVGKFVKQHARKWYPSTTGPLLPTVTDGLGILCLGMCCQRFTILSRAPNGMSNEHSHSDRIDLGHGGGGGAGGYCAASQPHVGSRDRQGGGGPRRPQGLGQGSYAEAPSMATFAEAKPESFLKASSGLDIPQRHKNEKVCP